jgi:uncharacterized protein (TIGR02996 family)
VNRTLAREQAAFLADIGAHPEDDAPRLVYADWLDEHSDQESDRARAEFIRLQIVEHRKPGYHPNGRPLTEREQQLLEAWNHPKHRGGWLHGLPVFPGLRVGTSDYERGFLYSAHALSVRSFLQAGPGLYACLPIDQLSIATITPGTAAELAASHYLACIRDLNGYLQQGWTDEVLAALAASPYLNGLRRCVLGGGGCPITGRGLGPFLANPALAQLSELMLLRCERIGPEGLAAIRAGYCARALQEVCLQDCHVGAEATADVVALMGLPGLRRLTLAGNDLDDRVAFALAGLAPTRLESVHLEFNRISDSGAEALLHAPLFRVAGCHLYLDGNRLSDGMKARWGEALSGRGRFV